MRRIYHLTTPAAWSHDSDRPYRSASLDAEGFIHCSNADQVAWAANRFHASAPALLVLAIEADRLHSPIKDEPAGASGVFPHIYGPINRDAVVEVIALERDDAGQWTFTPARDCLS